MAAGLLTLPKILAILPGLEGPLQQVRLLGQQDFTKGATIALGTALEREGKPEVLVRMTNPKKRDLVESPRGAGPVQAPGIWISMRNKGSKPLLELIPRATFSEKFGNIAETILGGFGLGRSIICGSCNCICPCDTHQTKLAEDEAPHRGDHS